MVEKMIWDKYKKTPILENRNALVMHYLPLVQKIVNIMTVDYHLKEDFYNVGVLGLIDAVDKFDMGKNVKFETYATIRIRGSIKDFMRQQDWVSRNVRDKEKQIMEAERILRQRYGKEPKDGEIAKAAKMSLTEYAQIKKHLDSASFASFEKVVAEGMNPTDLYEGKDNRPDSIVEKKEMEKILAQSITKLSQRKQQIIALYYHEELNLKEIGEVLEVSESRVSQIMKEINEELKNEIQSVLR
jgi:RNA polymerase sigma factor for flagellar operon FliA